MNNLIVKEGENKQVIYSEFDSLDFIVNKNASLTIKYCLFSNNKELEIKGKLNENARLKVVFADFSNETSQVHANIELNGKYAEALWDLATLATTTSKKRYDISFIHNEGLSKANMNNYGVCLDSSRIEFSGVNHIKNKCKKSITNQNAKIIVFDKEASGKANPILKIDENDVLANHSAIVGRLNDEHLFYLKSRGLTESEAKALIVQGYLKPIASNFDETIKNKIEKVIMERCHV